MRRAHVRADLLVEERRRAVVDVALGEDEAPVVLGLGGPVRGDDRRDVGDPRALEELQERDVVQVAHRVEVAEAHLVGVRERPSPPADVAHPQRSPVSCAATGSGLAGRPSGGSGSL